MFYYGTQYYRPPNPFPEFWEEDFKRMKDSGFNVVKLWAMWSTINWKEGEYDFEDLDRLCEIADKNRISVIFNTIVENAPYWLYVKHPEASHTFAVGLKTKPQSRGNTPAGGWPGLCLHNEPVRAVAQRFFEETAKHFKGMHNLYGYDIWNEINPEPNVFFSPSMYTGLYCYCEATQQKFKKWLKEKYGSLDALNEAWFRKYSDWNEVYAPIQRGGYPDMLDWLAFRTGDRLEEMQWRYDTMRNIDKESKLISHFATVGTAKNMTDIERLPDIVDEWGVSSFNPYDRAGNVTEKMMYRLDLARCGAKGKTFWQSELKGGQNTDGNRHRALKRSPMARESTMRGWNWCVLMGGAKGLMYWQYRPEQLGPETPGNGLTDLAGQETERLRQAHWFAEFTNKHTFIARTKPIRGDVAILKLFEAENFVYLLDDNTNWYEKAVAGAWGGFCAHNVVADIVSIDRMGNYPLVYIPFAQMIERRHIEKIKDYVRQGGTVVAEACTAHYLDRGYCAFAVPGEMTDMFGAKETIAESLFDVKELPTIHFDNGTTINAAIYQEWFETIDGTVIGKYEDGSVAAVENQFGDGRAIVIGSYPSVLFSGEPTDENAALFSYLAEKACVRQAIRSDNRAVKARIHELDGIDYVYMVNLRNEPVEATVAIHTRFGSFSSARSTTMGTQLPLQDNAVHISLAPCEGDILTLG